MIANSRLPVSSTESPWQVLLRLRWPLGGTIAVAFAVGQVVEAMLFGSTHSQQRVIFDVVGWGLLGGLAVWLSLTWVSRLERRYQVGLAESLQEQQELNRQMERANRHLALLSEVNRRIAESETLDQILDAAVSYPRRVVPASYATVLVLNNPAGPITTRVEGAGGDKLESLRARLAGAAGGATDHRARLLDMPEGRAGIVSACLLLPLYDGQTEIGAIEMYLKEAGGIADDERALLETIASEIAEAITGARRRSREERAIYELERAIADERARIARDIHDGIAQTLAFRRMRIDLWLDWIETDRDRLRAELIENKQILREQIAELRRAIFALRPVQFDELGFVGGLHRYILEFANQHGWETHVDITGAPAALTPELEATCFRLIQEALTNAAKHARATRVDVAIGQADGGLVVRIADDGGGFEPGAEPQAGSGRVGLRQMHERVAALSGRLTVLSRPGAGTEVRAWIPLAILI